MTITFGTDGWRGIIADDFTFENVRFCAQGVSDLLTSQNESRGVLVGYDTRFGSENFARAVAEVLAGNGHPVVICDRSAPTPTIAYNLVSHKKSAGIIITASHNAHEWNGFKYKPDYGGSASQDIIDNLESYISKAVAKNDPSWMELSVAGEKGLLDQINPEPDYFKHLSEIIDLELIKSSGLNIITDSMHGSGAEYFKYLLSGQETSVSSLRSEPNPRFPGMIQPEPVEQNLAELGLTVREQNADIGLATDGDADRLGVIDENGRYVNTLQVFSLLCLLLLDIRQQSGPIVKSITMSSMVDRLGEIYSVPVFKTPVGFKHLGPVMIKEKALLAGEESGGYAYRASGPERDGILSGLMTLELMVRTGLSISELIEKLGNMVGPHHYGRIDIKIGKSQTIDILNKMRRANPKQLAGQQVDYVDDQDGFQFILQNGYWSLVRLSGTEPIVRIYAESESPKSVEQLLKETRALAGI